MRTNPAARGRDDDTGGSGGVLALSAAVRNDTWRDGVRLPLWLDDPDRPVPRPAVTGEQRVDLLIVGGGFTGLWTALREIEAAIQTYGI